MMLRIEDIDPVRSRPQFIDAIFEDLGWLAMTWKRPPIYQSTRMAAYRKATAKLQAMGLLYPCFATRGDLLVAINKEDGAVKRDPDGVPLYPGLWRGADPGDVAARIEAGVPYALRLNMAAALAADREMNDSAPLQFEEAGVGGDAADADMTPAGFARDVLSDPVAWQAKGASRLIAADPARWGDVVLVRKDTPTSYHLAVVVDDATEGISTVIRGMDLFAATDIHRLLQRLLGLPAPRYCHHPLIRDDAGEKLSKSQGHQSIADLRAAGLTPQVIQQQLLGA